MKSIRVSLLLFFMLAMGAPLNAGWISMLRKLTFGTLGLVAVAQLADCQTGTERINKAVSIVNTALWLKPTLDLVLSTERETPADEHAIELRKQRDPVMVFIEEQITFAGLNPQHIIIYNRDAGFAACGKKMGCPLGTIRKALEQKKQNELNAMRYAIAHECGHIKHHDTNKVQFYYPLVTGALTTYLYSYIPAPIIPQLSAIPRTLLKQKMQRMFMQCLRYVNERRADTFATQVFRNSPDVLKAAALEHTDSFRTNTLKHAHTANRWFALPGRLINLYHDEHGSSLARAARLLTAAHISTTEETLSASLKKQAQFWARNRKQIKKLTPLGGDEFFKSFQPFVDHIAPDDKNHAFYLAVGMITDHLWKKNSQGEWQHDELPQSYFDAERIIGKATADPIAHYIAQAEAAQSKTSVAPSVVPTSDKAIGTQPAKLPDNTATADTKKDISPTATDSRT